jgi:hypothetical protein
MMTGWELLCSAKQRGWADSLTSWNLFEELGCNSRDIVKVGNRGMPLRSLLPFCHEITHHLIFDTPVGAALAAIENQGRQMAARWQRSGAADEQTKLAILENQLRYHTVAEFYKPLNEGLALFAEYDGLCGMAERPSVRMQWSARLFVVSAGQIYNPNAHEVFPIFHKFRICRSSPSVIERKAQLLSRPLKCVHDGVVEGDLAGYLLVKNFFILTAQQTHVVDSDMFVSRMIGHFFEDLELVRLLQAPRSKTIVEAVNHSDQILTHIALRFADAGFTAYDPKAASVPTAPRTASDGDLMPHRRELMCLARLQADAAQCGERVDVYCQGEQLGSFAAIGRPRSRKAPAIIEYFISPRERYEAYTVTIPPDVAAVFADPPDSRSDLTVRLAKIVSNREETRKRAGEESAVLASVGKQLIDANNLGVIYEDTLQRIEKFYSGMALGRTPKIRLETLQAHMRDNGFLGLFNNDKDLLHRYTALSSFTAVLPSKKVVAELAATGKMDLDTALAEFRRWSDRTGIKLVAEVGDTICTYA